MQYAMLEKRTKKNGRFLKEFIQPVERANLIQLDLPGLTMGDYNLKNILRLLFC